MWGRAEGEEIEAAVCSSIKGESGSGGVPCQGYAAEMACAWGESGSREGLRRWREISAAARANGASERWGYFIIRSRRKGTPMASLRLARSEARCMNISWRMVDEDIFTVRITPLTCSSVV